MQDYNYYGPRILINLIQPILDMSIIQLLPDRMAAEAEEQSIFKGDLGYSRHKN